MRGIGSKDVIAAWYSSFKPLPRGKRTKYQCAEWWETPLATGESVPPQHKPQKKCRNHETQAHETSEIHKSTRTAIKFGRKWLAPKGGLSQDKSFDNLVHELQLPNLQSLEYCLGHWSLSLHNDSQMKNKPCSRVPPVESPQWCSAWSALWYPHLVRLASTMRLSTSRSAAVVRNLILFVARVCCSTPSWVVCLHSLGSNTSAGWKRDEDADTRTCTAVPYDVPNL